MQAELQTALFQAFDTLNLQRVKTFSVPPVTLCGLGALGACGQEAQARGVSHLFVMVDSFLHQAGMAAPLARSLAMKGVRRRSGLWRRFGAGRGESGRPAGD